MTPEARAKKAENHKRYMREVWYPKNRAKHIALVAESKKVRMDSQRAEIALLKLKCKYCPENYPACLSFHHRNPKEKDIAIADAVSHGWSIEKIKTEIKKCDVVCENCHRKIHSGGVDLVLRCAHNAESAGSNPVSASKV